MLLAILWPILAAISLKSGRATDSPTSGQSKNVESLRRVTFVSFTDHRVVLDVRRISKPNGLGEVQSRISYNLGRYSSNYSVIFALLAIYALITNPLLLFVIGLAIGGMLGIGKLNGENLTVG